MWEVYAVSICHLADRIRTLFSFNVRDRIPQFVAYCDFPQVKGKMIAITQPRRVAAVSVARRVAEEMDGMFFLHRFPCIY